MTKQLAIDALRAAYWRKKPLPGLLHHSDRGSQYCSGTYRALQVSYKMKTSMALALGHPVGQPLGALSQQSPFLLMDVFIL